MDEVPGFGVLISTMVGLIDRGRQKIVHTEHAGSTTTANPLHRPHNSDNRRLRLPYARLSF